MKLCGASRNEQRWAGDHPGALLKGLFQAEQLPPGFEPMGEPVFQGSLCVGRCVHPCGSLFLGE